MFLNIDNLSINYIDFSDNTENTIIILHGWGSNIDVHHSMIEYLKPNMRVIALDMPGFGKSSEIENPMNVSDYADFIIKFIGKLNIKKASFLGHSFGGRVIIKLLNKKNLPFVMDKIVLIDSAGIKPKKSLTTIAKVKIYKLIKKIFQIPIIDKMYPNFIQNMKKRLGSSDYNSASVVMQQTLVKVVEEDLKEEIKKIKNDTLLIWGENDDATPIQDGILMNKLIENSALIKIENAGHYSFLEDPIKVNSIILSFLNEGK